MARVDLSEKDRASGRVSARVVGKVDGATLTGFVSDHAEPGAAIYTDEAVAYSRLGNRESVGHGVGEYVRGQAQINGIESFWSIPLASWRDATTRAAMTPSIKWPAWFVAQSGSGCATLTL